ncbi:MAG: SUMF1/EgtB/PvdO family nonheme iron enzyme [Magnetococcales bacterium]|nr:SUMF1/EgtB/PvdO family nonheme iron enzyme [Magnetococcales bacterium]
MSRKSHHNALPNGTHLLWYEVIRVLGKGGFGITYLAKDTNHDQLVAIKEYLPAGIGTREQGKRDVQPNSSADEATFKWGLDRFLKEAQVLARFKHPSIVKIQSFFKDANTAYMVMDYEQGEGLNAILKRRKTLTQREVSHILPPILDGLETLHNADYIHRDIKPPNILIRKKTNTPVILDFGSARQAITGQSNEMTSLLSLGYSPFEQYDSSGANQGPWSDIYALAGVLYRIICGRKPVDAMVRANARLRNQNDPLMPAIEVGKGRYSETFLKAIDRGLAVMEQDRPQSINVWRTMLLGAYGTLQDSDIVAADKPHTEDKKPAATPPSKNQSVPKIKRKAPRKKKNAWRSFISSLDEFGTQLGGNFDKGKKTENIDLDVEENKKSVQERVLVKEPEKPEEVRKPMLMKLHADREAGDVWQEYLTGMSFIWAPTGKFFMGSDREERGRRPDEGPRHEVSLDGFWIGQYPVTWAEWNRVMGDNPRGVYKPAMEKYPVERTDWRDVKQFITRYSGMLQSEYDVRLPSEAEWEYAARGGAETVFFFGDDPSQLKEYAWYLDNACGRPRPVGEKQPNPWGIYDQLGNVWEWTEDWYAAKYYQNSPEANPKGAESGQYRVRRGGCWKSSIAACRPAHRNRVTETTRGNSMGFRIVLRDTQK